MTDAAIEVVLRRDRVVVGAALLAVMALAWAYLLRLSSDMDMGGMDMTGFRMIPAGIGIMAPAQAPWTGIEFAFVFAMWAVMMVGMMTPSAAPMILLYARVGRQATTEGKPLAASGWFAGGYLLALSSFSLAATLTQWAIERASLLTPKMAGASGIFGGAVLVAAGLYQWTPLKEACLSQCRSPLMFIQRHGGFRGTASGALGLGLRHGAYCVGCCWALMTLLFVGGVMNVLWIAAIAALVLLEKVVPTGRVIPRVAGTGFVVAGIWLLTMAARG
jgi:predicted metal-binding membrane protein